MLVILWHELVEALLDLDYPHEKSSLFDGVLEVHDITTFILGDTNHGLSQFWAINDEVGDSKCESFDLLYFDVHRIQVIHCDLSNSRS